MVGRVALGGQRPALDRVGEHDARAVAHGVGLAVGVDQRGEVVPAEVAEGGQQVAVGEPRDVDLQALAQLGRARAQQPLVLLVGHRVHALAQRRVAGQPRAVLDHHAVPAGRLEHRGQPPRGDVGHHAVQRLAVEVDDPHDLAELGHHRVGDRLPAGALVELGVADQRDLAAADRDVEVPGDVAVRERAPHRRGRPEADRAGRVVDRVGVLGAAGVGLQAAELAQRGQVAAVQAAEQVVDRVQHRRGVRLDRHAVGRLEVGEPQRGHQAHHRGAGGLVAADLHARRVRAHPVGVVDDRRGQPQHPPLHAVQGLEVEVVAGRLGEGGHGCRAYDAIASRRKHHPALEESTVAATQTDVRTFQNFIDGEWTAPAEGRTEAVLNPATGEAIAPRAAVDRRGRRPRRRRRAHRVRVVVGDDTPASARSRCSSSPTRSRQRADEFARARGRERRQAAAGVQGRRVPAMVDNLRFFAGAARNMEGKAAGEYLEGYTSMVRREPVGVVGQIAPVELPADDGDLEDRPGARDRQHDRPQAGRDDPADARCCSARSPRSSSPRACSTSSAATATRPARRSSRTPTSTWSRSPARWRRASGSPAPRPTRSSASTSSSAARRRSSSSTTPTWRPRWRRSPAPATTTPARTAPPPRACSPLEGLRRRPAGPRRPGQGLQARRHDGSRTRRSGPSTRQRQRERVEGFLERRPDHAEIVTGGKEPDLPGFFLEPTVVGGLRQDDEMIQKEIFGPVITVQPFTDEAEAIAWANGTPVRPRLLGLDARRRPRPARLQGAALRLRVDQRPHPARLRDAARRLRPVRLRQGPLDVLARGLHADQARHGEPELAGSLVRGTPPGALGLAAALLPSSRRFCEPLRRPRGRARAADLERVGRGGRRAARARARGCAAGSACPARTRSRAGRGGEVTRARCSLAQRARWRPRRTRPPRARR